MKRKILISTAAGLLLLSLLASPAAAETGGSGRVSVSASARSQVVCTIVDQDHVELRSNAPWRLTVETRHGIEQYEGRPTGSGAVAIPLPADTIRYSAELSN